MALRGLAGKVTIVTGAASGIGAGAARRLSEEGAAVVLVDRDGRGAEDVSRSLAGESLVVEADVSREEDVERYTKATVDRFGRIDLYHLNAGIAGNLALFPEATVEEFDQVLAVNVRGVFLGLREAFRQYRRQDGGGAAVTTASICSFGGSADLVAYHASKHAIVGLMRSAAVYGGPIGIRVNAVAPGIVPTNLLGQPAESTAGESGTSARARLAPLQRPGTTEEIAAVVAFLLSDEASFATGDVYSVDGGAIAVNPVRPYSP